MIEVGILALLDGTHQHLQPTDLLFVKKIAASKFVQAPDVAKAGIACVGSF